MPGKTEQITMAPLPKGFWIDCSEMVNHMDNEEDIASIVQCGEDTRIAELLAASKP
jgi:hypothetical protein